MNEAGLNRFAMSVKQWVDKTRAKGLIAKAGRYGGTYASINELICLSNIENINSVMINDGISQSKRLKKLNKIAIQQMTILEEDNELKMLK